MKQKIIFLGILAILLGSLCGCAKNDTVSANVQLTGGFINKPWNCKHEYEMQDDGTATCLEDGEVTWQCTLCGKEQVREQKALGHNLEPHCSKNPTFFSVGWGSYRSCSRCELSSYQPIIPWGVRIMAGFAIIAVFGTVIAGIVVMRKRKVIINNE